MEVITNHSQLAQLALEHLAHVDDPEMGLSVVDLGLIYQLHFDEHKRRLFVSMTLTTRFCPMGESITIGVRQALEMAFLGYEVDVRLTFDPAWTADNISEAGRRYLEQ